MSLIFLGVGWGKEELMEAMGVCLDIASPWEEKLKFSAVDVENSLCVILGGSSNRLGAITLTGSCSGSLKA